MNTQWNVARLPFVGTLFLEILTLKWLINKWMAYSISIILKAQSRTQKILSNPIPTVLRMQRI